MFCGAVVCSWGSQNRIWCTVFMQVHRCCGLDSSQMRNSWLQNRNGSPIYRRKDPSTAHNLLPNAECPAIKWRSTNRLHLLVQHLSSLKVNGFLVRWYETQVEWEGVTVWRGGLMTRCRLHKRVSHIPKNILYRGPRGIHYTLCTISHTVGENCTHAWQTNAEPRRYLEERDGIVDLFKLYSVSCSVSTTNISLCMIFIFMFSGPTYTRA